MLPGMRTPGSLLVAGAALLGASLLLALYLTEQASSGSVGPQGIGVLSWLSQAGLYVGAGLVVGGAVLRVLRTTPPGRQRGDAPFGQTDYWGG